MSLFTALALGTVTRSLLLAALCALGAWLLRSRPAAIRFSLWKWALFALIALPVFTSLKPPVPHSVRPITRIRITAMPHVIAPATSPADSATIAAVPTNRRLSPLAIYLFITCLLLARLAYNLLQLHRLASNSQSISDPIFQTTANLLWLQSGASAKPRFATSHEVTVPVTVNTFGDTWILLPPTFAGWDQSKLRTVLAHELGHVQRQDSSILTLAALATCLFWFHPLSWFLQRQLSRLAEEACDEIVLAAAETTPAHYAQVLIAFARDIRLQQRRISVTATAVVRKPNLQHRLERLFAHTRPLQKSLAFVLLALFVGAFYLTAAARFHQPQQQSAQSHSPQPWPDWERFTELSATDINNLEAALRANPDDYDSRMELIVYYAHANQEQPFTDHILWFIRHNPSQENLTAAQWLFPPTAPLSDTAREQLRVTWEDAVTENPDEPAVLLNAASFIERTNQIRGLDLLRQAQALVPAQQQKQILWDIAMIYVAAEMQSTGSKFMINNLQIGAATAATLRADLSTSKDPKLLTVVGRSLREQHLPDGSDTPAHEIALNLVHRANQLDPSNKEVSDETKFLDQIFPSVEKLLHEPQVATTEVIPRGSIRLSPAVAEANLIHKIEPIYPPEAKAAHIQGIVEFTADIGTDGTVTALRLVRGNPALVNAAKDAVLKSVFHAAIQDGTPVPFTTQIFASFNLPQ